MRLYGLIGYPLEHSYSPVYFNEKFGNLGIGDCEYRLFPLSNLESFKHLPLDYPDLCGLNITIPYKEAIMPFLDKLTAQANQIQAVNAIRILRKGNNIEMLGHNTDAPAFLLSLLPHLESHHNKALIFGSGGAAKAVSYVLGMLRISYLIVSRQKNISNNEMVSYSDLTPSLINEYPLLINCTPVGMFPHTEEMLPIPFEGISPEHLIYDLIYNPLVTRFMAIAQQRGAKTVNGLQMFKYQADLSWDFWNEAEDF